VGDDGESADEGGRELVEGRTPGVSETSSLDDEHPVSTMQAAATMPASLAYRIRFMAFFLLFPADRRCPESRAAAIHP